MGYKLAWDSPQKVLRLSIFDDVPLQTFVEIDRRIHDCLRECEAPIALIVDASNVRISPYGIEGIKASQTYLQSQRIERLVVISSNKLNRLAMLLLFNLSRPILQFCDNSDQAQRFLELSRWMYRTAPPGKSI